MIKEERKRGRESTGIDIKEKKNRYLHGEKEENQSREKMIIKGMMEKEKRRGRGNKEEEKRRGSCKRKEDKERKMKNGGEIGKKEKSKGKGENNRK